jgi:regulator of replication initiation timing
MKIKEILEEEFLKKRMEEIKKDETMERLKEENKELKKENKELKEELKRRDKENKEMKKHIKEQNKEIIKVKEENRIITIFHSTSNLDFKIDGMQIDHNSGENIFLLRKIFKNEIFEMFPFFF